MRTSLLFCLTFCPFSRQLTPILDCFFFFSFLPQVGRILDTIFNNNHDSTPTLLSNGGGVSNRDVGDDFVLPETSSQSSQSGVHSVALPSLPSLSSLSSTSSALATHSSPRTTDTTTSTANNSTVQRAHRSISPQKESTASIPNDVSGNAEMRVPEACTNEAEGAASNAMCSSNGTNDNASSSSSSGSTSRTTSTGTTTVNSTAAPVSITSTYSITLVPSSLIKKIYF